MILMYKLPYVDFCIAWAGVLFRVDFFILDRLPESLSENILSNALFFCVGNVRMCDSLGMMDVLILAGGVSVVKSFVRPSIIRTVGAD